MKKILSIIGLISTPVVSLAANGVDTTYVDSLIRATGRILNGAILVLISGAIVWFIWNVIRYTMSKDLEKKTEAKQQMIWGIVGLAVCVSIWGIIALFRGAFGIDGKNKAPSDLDNLIPIAGQMKGPAPTGTTFDSNGKAFAPGYNPNEF